MVKLNLEATGDFEVQEVNWAPATIQPARKFKPDLILMNVVMPNVDGGELAARLQTDPVLRTTPIIFLTATVSNRESAHRGLNSGGFLFLAKPVSQADLIQCINDHVKAPSPSPPAPAGPAAAQHSRPVAD
jgi:CheY-like chemotaxis protein